MAVDATPNCIFLSTLPARGATPAGCHCQKDQAISIHAPREGSDSGSRRYSGRSSGISIHAPREGSDVLDGDSLVHQGDFYPRSPRGERQSGVGYWYSPSLFLSTLPARGATLVMTVRPSFLLYFYPRSPRGERPPTGQCTTASGSYFYPRSPRGERPVKRAEAAAQRAISIHAPREGSDPDDTGRAVGRLISIHAPREGSDKLLLFVIQRHYPFLSTLPARGATLKRSILAFCNHIFLSTLPARGATWKRPMPSAPRSIFLSTLPARGATYTAECARVCTEFLSTLPARGATRDVNQMCGDGLFLSTLPARGATSWSWTAPPNGLFLSTLPARGATL